MSWELSETEVRIVGSLLEKEVTTPEYYPLSLNALALACNQKTNRDPVLSLADDLVLQALELLRERGLVCFVREAGSRVEKYRQRITEVLNLDCRELAVLCVLMLRGAQTVGELRERTHRLYAFDDLQSVELCLKRMMERNPVHLVARIDRATGIREPRYVQLLAGTPPVPGDSRRLETVVTNSDGSLQDRLGVLEAEVMLLKREISALRDDLSRFRSQFE